MASAAKWMRELAVFMGVVALLLFVFEWKHAIRVTDLPLEPIPLVKDVAPLKGTAMGEWFVFVDPNGVQDSVAVWADTQAEAVANESQGVPAASVLSCEGFQLCDDRGDWYNIPCSLPFVAFRDHPILGILGACQKHLEG